MIKEVVEIDVKVEGAIQNTGKVKNSVKEVKKETNDLSKEISGKLTDSIDNMTGGAVSGFKKLVTGVGSAVKSFGTLKVAILSTGVGALVIAFGALITYFTQTERGAEKLKEVFSAVGAVVNVLKDRISGLGEGIALILSGKFAEGGEKLKNTFKGVGDEIRKESKLAVQLERDLEALEDREIAAIEVNAKKKASIEALRLAAEDESKSNKERAASLQQAIKLQNEITNEEIAIAKEKARISQAQLDMGESTDEQVRANAELQARVVELEGERDRSLKRVTTRLNAFTKETKDNTDALNKQREALAAIDRELQKFLIDFDKKIQDQEANTTLKRLELEKNRVLQQAAILGASEEQKLQIQKFYNDQIIAERNRVNEEIEKQEQEAEDLRANRNAERLKKEKENAEKNIQNEILLKQQKVAIIGQTFGAISEILGKNSKIGKAAAIAQATINTYQGVTEVWSTKSALPEPFATISRIANTAVVLASGLNAVRQIKSTKLPQGDVGGGGGVSQAAPTQVQAPSFNIVGSSGTNQLATAIGSQTQQPIKAYVVNSEQRTAEALERNIISSASLG